MTENKSVTDDFWKDVPVISVYTLAQAIDDGVLAKVGDCGNIPVIFTTNLLHDGYENKDKRLALVRLGLQLLNKPDEEDTDYMKLRVIEDNKIWVVQDEQAITFMRPEDY